MDKSRNLILTDAAAKRVQALIDKKNDPNLFLRVTVTQQGSSLITSKLAWSASMCRFRCRLLSTASADGNVLYLAICRSTVWKVCDFTPD